MINGVLITEPITTHILDIRIMATGMATTGCGSR
jgi:hypothetical protein